MKPQQTFYPATKTHEIYINENCKLYCLNDDVYNDFFEKYKNTLLSKKLNEDTLDKEIPQFSKLFGRTTRFKHLVLVGDVNEVDDTILKDLFSKERLDNTWYNTTPKENGDIQQSCKDFTPTEMLKSRLETYSRSYFYVNKEVASLNNGVLINWGVPFKISDILENKKQTVSIIEDVIEYQELDKDTIKDVLKDIQEND
jgi:hypothetical protein